MITAHNPPLTPYAQTSKVHSYFWPTEIDAFNFPLCEEFLRGPLFVCVASAVIDVDAMVEAYGDRLERAAQSDRCSPRGRWKTVHEQLLFRLEPDCWAFISTNVGGCRVFARDRANAERIGREIATRFRVHRPARGKTHFHLLSIYSDGSVIPRAVLLPPRSRRTPEELALLYGPDCPAWEEKLCRSLKARSTGTVILRGPPGTGKTSLIRHLISRLFATHRFFYVPVTSFGLLTEPRLVEFWSEVERLIPKTQRVVVLEDAEALLTERSEGERGDIANMLNISDGLLGDFLKMQLVCTVNCDLDRLDPAIVRSGRLIDCREFSRIPRDRARQIAERHQIQLPPQADYSLAEIFRGKPQARAAAKRPLLGFAAAAVPDENPDNEMVG